MYMYMCIFNVLDLCSFPVKFWLLLSVLMIDARFLLCIPTRLAPLMKTPLSSTRLRLY